MFLIAPSLHRKCDPQKRNHVAIKHSLIPVTTNISWNPAPSVVLRELVAFLQTWQVSYFGRTLWIRCVWIIYCWCRSVLTHVYRLERWQVRETVPLYPDTAINTHEAVCHPASILSGGSYASYDTSVRVHASCPHTMHWCGSLLNNLCFFTRVIG